MSVETPDEKAAKAARRKAALLLAGCFVIMILGMVGKVYYDHLTKDTVFALSQIILPLIVAPMVYGAIYAALKSLTDPVPALILPFQNGFFWQDVFNGIKPPPPAQQKVGELITMFASLLT
jgi:hypothetical protein